MNCFSFLFFFSLHLYKNKKLYPGEKFKIFSFFFFFRLRCILIFTISFQLKNEFW